MFLLEFSYYLIGIRGKKVIRNVWVIGKGFRLLIEVNFFLLEDRVIIFRK